MLYITVICKIIKGNEEANRVAKQAMDLLGMTTIRLSYTDYYMTI